MVAKVATETACFGFVRPEGVDGGEWQGVCQRPFRGRSLVLLGDGVLVSLVLGADEQLSGPLPFEVMRMQRRELIAPALLQLFIDPAARKSLPDLTNARCNDRLSKPPFLQLPSISVGQLVAFRFSGRAYAVLLVGEQVL